jgi:GAF domain-containing protein
MFEKVVEELHNRLDHQRDFITNASNLSAVLYELLPNLNWVGFYMLSGNELLLGPFQGKAARQIIPMGQGVCGTTAEKRETVIVEDVHEFPGHIACDCASNSEIVVPIIKDGKLYGVLDIDSPYKMRFIEEEIEEFEKYVEILIETSDMEKIWQYYNE